MTKRSTLASGYYPLVFLHPGRDESIRRRHQWIFSKAIRKKDKQIADGDLVSVCDAQGNVIATAHFQDRSLALRILDFGNTRIDQNFWLQKFGNAHAYRSALKLSEQPTNAYRFLHGEGDELPGLIVDIYDRVAVVQAHSIGMYRQRKEIAGALMQCSPINLTGVYDKSMEELRAAGEQAEESQWIAGNGDSTIRITEHGLLFFVDLVRGQKTGFFLDQRENRALVKHFSRDKEVLNCFCYTGGFTIAALSGQAGHVTSIDASGHAMEVLGQNLTLNGFADHQHTSVTGDVMQFLTQSQNTYDVLVCDPPAFAKSIHKRHNAVQAYKRLNALALKRIRPGGMLFTFSCSQVVDRQLFYDTIVAAAIEVNKKVRVLFEMRQGPDHPVSLYHPEGSYLKGLVLHIS